MNLFQRFPLLKHILYMIGVSVVILFLVFLFIKMFARQGKEYELPDMRGQALAALEDENPLDFHFVVIDSLYNPDVEGGTVLQQDPKPGTMVKSRRKIYVTLASYAPADVVLPELSNMSVRSAVSALEAAGLVCGRLRFVDSPYRNVILDCSCKGKMVYAGEKMSQGAVVDLTVGIGEGVAATRVPFVIGQVPAKVRRGILASSLNVGREHFEGVTDRATAVCYRLDPDYTGVTRYPLGTDVEIWYCDASEADAERIIATFKVDSTKIIRPDDDEFYISSSYDDDYDYPSNDDDWDW